MRRFGRIFALVLVAVAVTLAAGCGGDDEEGKGIPAATADTLNAQLQQVQDRINQGSVGACKDILEAPDERGADKKQVQAAIDDLPDDVDADVKSALQDSFDHLWDLVEQECEDRASEQEKQNTTPTETQETTPTETQTETTPTETETTPTETTPPAEEQLPGGEGNGTGGGALPGAGEGGGAGPGAQKLEKEKKKK